MERLVLSEGGLTARSGDARRRPREDQQSPVRRDGRLRGRSRVRGERELRREACPGEMPVCGGGERGRDLDGRGNRDSPHPQPAEDPACRSDGIAGGAPHAPARPRHPAASLTRISLPVAAALDAVKAPGSEAGWRRLFTTPWAGLSDPPMSRCFANYQKSYCTVSFAVRAVSTSFGTSHGPIGSVVEVLGDHRVEVQRVVEIDGDIRALFRSAEACPTRKSRMFTRGDRIWSGASRFTATLGAFPESGRPREVPRPRSARPSSPGAARPGCS